ncbi:uncharacterized protein A1O5_12980 [Cladophialophora psammophila CBS 110553]|uniref:Mid2 domain-containing protein n=1 Tax=Cladophialophora psammophila CBS 110553 TaxID=1182543 RepID=W9VNM3_9EURO|nr:uncharacterized protein A1O5_12980 [Cladophialophora psammophila CBS 110553]EXJ53731.1 hypothetical protein A1O5_12980 [Cladophialophora psammophila CBS 110553]
MSIFVLLVLGSSPATLAETCYNNIGNQDTGFVACDPNAESSACCSPGDICYSNGLCQPGPEQPNKGITPYYVDGCTDPSWNSPVCMAKCLNVTGNGVETCGGLNQYCCYGFGGCDCSNSTQVISIAAGIVITTIPMTSSTASISNSSTSSTTSVPSSTDSFRSATTTPASKLSSFTSVLASPTAVSSNSSNQSSTSLSTGAKAGIGIGVGLGAALALIGLAFFLMGWRRRTRPSYNAQDHSKPGYKLEVNARQDGEAKRWTEQNFHELSAHRDQTLAEMDAP